MAKTKETTSTATATPEEEFNYFEYFKYQTLKAYYKAKLTGNSTDVIDVDIKNPNIAMNTYFYKAGAVKKIEYKTINDETGKITNIVTITGLNPLQKAISKAGKEYYVFDAQTKGRAITGAEKELE